MIKVNLLRNSGLANLAVSSSAAARTESVVTPEVRKNALLKLGVLLVIPLALYAYERSNFQDAVDKYESLQARIRQLQSEKSKYGDTTQRVEKYTREKQRIDKELDSLRTLSQRRLREVKALDALQTLIPERVWMKKLIIEGTVVKLEGFSATEEAVTRLIRSMESSAYFSQVEPKNITQESVGSGQAIKFEIECRAGKAD